MDGLTFAIIAGTVAALVILAVFWLAPAHVTAEIDSERAKAHFGMGLLWGRGPTLKLATRSSAERGGGAAMGFFRLLRDTPRITHALMVAPKLFPEVRTFIKRIRAHHPKMARLTLSLNVVDPRANMAISVAEKLLAPFPGVSVTLRDQAGLDIAAKFDGRVSPLALAWIYLSFRNAPATRDFMQRLRTGGVRRA